MENVQCHLTIVEETKITKPLRERKDFSDLEVGLGVGQLSDYLKEESSSWIDPFFFQELKPNMIEQIGESS